MIDLTKIIPAKTVYAIVNEETGKPVTAYTPDKKAIEQYFAETTNISEDTHKIVEKDA